MSSQRLLRRLPARIPDPLRPEERPQPHPLPTWDLLRLLGPLQGGLAVQPEMCSQQRLHVIDVDGDAMSPPEGRFWAFCGRASTRSFEYTP